MGRSHSSQRWVLCSQGFRKQEAGYTLLETMVVLAIIGALMAIAVPSFAHILDVRLLNNAQDQILQTLRQAQRESQYQRVNYRASFREVDGVVQGSIHPSTALPTDIAWTNLPAGIRIDATATTFYQNRQGVYFIQFNYRGNVSGRLGRMTVHRPNRAMPKRCVFASTLLGAMRRDMDRNCARR
ncbi:MAG: type II secretion system protein [Cyanobacteria bacterium J06638_20]